MPRECETIFVNRGGVCLVIPERGDPYYIRASDGAIGRRRGDSMFWAAVVENDFETIATEVVGDEVLPLDTAAEELTAAIERVKA